MEYGMVLQVLGKLLLLESALLLPPLGISLYLGQEDSKSFIITILISLISGLILSRFKGKEENIGIREGLSIVTLGWIILSLVGSLPLYLSGGVPTFIDAFFETVSGFTTTGATVIGDVEALPQGILFWRSFTHWIGGMGILVFTIALLPALGIGGFQIFKAESPGPVAGKIAPRIKDTAKILYIIYGGLTIVQVVLLLIGGMNFFDSLVYTFGTVGTGGLATKNNSIAFYDSTYLQLVIGVFMVISGINFSLYYLIYQGKWKEAVKDEELRLYLIIITIATIGITINLLANSYNSISLALKDSFFQVGSIITTTGYSTTDFNLWPDFSKAILLFLMMTGGSAGSTAGGTKIIRWVVLLKVIKREILKTFHPRAVKPIKVNGEVVGEETINGITAYMAFYVIIFLISTIIITLEVDLVTSFSSVAATLGNIGPGLNLAGPASNFGFYSPLAKLFFSFLMLLGRLELFTMIALIVPQKWSRIDN